MILLLTIFLPLLVTTFPTEEGSHLPKEVKEELEKQFGTDLKTRVENLRKIGYEYPAPEVSNKRMDATPEESIEEDLSIWEINERAGIARYFWDGDIDLTQEQFEMIERNLKNDSSVSYEKRQARQDWSKKWIKRKVYYYFDDNFGINGRKMVKEVIDFFEKNTCIRFKENPTAVNRLKIHQRGGCGSSLGVVGGEQGLSLNEYCWMFGTVAHELLHALGFMHAHVRPDRDDYVSINKENIESKYWKSNFPKLDKPFSSIYTPYEYASVMHYPADAFSLKNKHTVIAKDHRYAYTMGSRRKLTFYDVKALNEHYMCTAMCPPMLSAKCSNGGFPNPNKCSVCICPDGYGGQF